LSLFPFQTQACSQKRSIDKHVVKKEQTNMCQKKEQRQTCGKKGTKTNM
jgi:hypothetical protein